MAATTKNLQLPDLDPKGFSRNPKTAWLLYLDKLTAWLWQDNEGAARWTLILDNALRQASTNHPPRTAAGLKHQVNHQSRLKHALVHAFAPHYPTTISLHPNTEALDASGNIVPFGTNLLRAICIEIVPEDSDGVTRAHLELLRQIKTFPGLQHGLNPLKAWGDRILLLFNDLGRLTAPIDHNQTICSHLDMLITSYGNPPSDPLSWNRCKDLLKSHAAYVANPSVSLYLQHIKRFAGDHVASNKLLPDGPATKSRGHFKTVYSAEALPKPSAGCAVQPATILATARCLPPLWPTTALSTFTRATLATTTRAAAPRVVGDLLHATMLVEVTTAITTRVLDTTATTTHAAATPACAKTGEVLSRLVSPTART